MRDRHAIVEEQRRDDRGAHAFALGLRARGLIDDLVGPVDRIPQDDARAGHAGVLVEHGEVFALHLLADQVEHGLHGDAARDFARVVAAHAVGEHQQADVAIGGDRVLVVLADFAGVRHPDAADLRAQRHPRSPRPRSCEMRHTHAHSGTRAHARRAALNAHEMCNPTYHLRPRNVAVSPTRNGRHTLALPCDTSEPVFTNP